MTAPRTVARVAGLVLVALVILGVLVALVGLLRVDFGLLLLRVEVLR